MEKFTNKYKDFIFESLQEQLKNKINEPYSSLKRGILDLLDKTLRDNTNLVDVQNLIHNYIEDPDKNIINGFVDDSEQFDFYLKYQGDIDAICSETDFFTKDHNVFSLYKYVIEGTKHGVTEALKIMENELFK